MEDKNEGFRIYLQDQLLEKTRKNPKFSIRSFAKQLDIESSSFSQIIHGKRKLTNNMCRRLAFKLGLSEAEFQQINATNKSNSEVKTLQLETFKVISDWYHFAILELTRVNDFKGDLQWIAKCLDLPIHIVQIAVERLLRLDFLKIHEDGRWEDTLGEASNTGNQFTEIALRKLQKQILEKAMKALDEVKYTERVQSAMTMAFSKKLLPQSKLKIIQFINELNSDAQEAGDFDEVYQLSVSLYPISDSERNKK